jgi:hypothetical protein
MNRLLHLLMLLCVAGCNTTYSPLLYLFNDAVDYEEGEDAVFRGRVVDAETGAAVDSAEVRLELLRLVPFTKRVVFHTVGIIDTTARRPFFYRSPAVGATHRCAPVDTLGATGSYERINEIFREEEREAFIFNRSRVYTDQTGHFQIESERRLYTSPYQTEASFQRLVVEKEGYALSSQGVLSTCEDHLDALRPVRLQPAHREPQGS